MSRHQTSATHGWRQSKASCGPSHQPAGRGRTLMAGWPLSVRAPIRPAVEQNVDFSQSPKQSPMVRDVWLFLFPFISISIILASHTLDAHDALRRTTRGIAQSRLEAAYQWRFHADGHRQSGRPSVRPAGAPRCCAVGYVTRQQRTTRRASSRGSHIRQPAAWPLLGNSRPYQTS